MTFETLNLTINGAFAEIALNRPKAMNAFNGKMADELPIALSELSGNNEVRVLLLKGNGPAFMAGGDVKMMYEDLDTLSHTVLPLAQQLHQAIEMLRALPYPVLGCVHGAVAGAGMSLMMACDLVIAEAKTEFCMAYNLIGVSPDGGATFFLPRHVGTKKAAELIFLSERLDAKTASEFGLINWYEAEDKLVERTQKLVEKLANGPTKAYGETKRLLNQSQRNTLGKQLDDEAHTFAKLCDTKDFKAGVSAFVTKQKPEFTGE